MASTLACADDLVSKIVSSTSMASSRVPETQFFLRQQGQQDLIGALHSRFGTGVLRPLPRLYELYPELQGQEWVIECFGTHYSLKTRHDWEEEVKNDLPFPQTALEPLDQELFLEIYGEQKVDAVVVAAGVGARMQAKCPKQYLKLGNKTILEHTVEKLLACPYIHQVVLVLSPEDAYFTETSLAHVDRIKRVAGGAERADSVLCGLSAVETSWALVHDCARPFVQLKDIEKLLMQVAHGVSAGCIGGLLVSPVADTLKQKESASEEPSPFTFVEKTLDRSCIYRAQTPQLFPTAFLKRSLERCARQGLCVTDEASVLDHVAGKAILVEGSALNFKLTTPEDLLIAQALISHNSGSTEFC